jgi:hypothetical protein
MWHILKDIKPVYNSGCQIRQQSYSVYMIFIVLDLSFIILYPSSSSPFSCSTHVCMRACTHLYMLIPENCMKLAGLYILKWHDWWSSSVNCVAIIKFNLQMEHGVQQDLLCSSLQEWMARLMPGIFYGTKGKQCSV